LANCPVKALEFTLNKLLVTQIIIDILFSICRHFDKLSASKEKLVIRQVI